MRSMTVVCRGSASRWSILGLCLVTAVSVYLDKTYSNVHFAAPDDTSLRNAREILDVRTRAAADHGSLFQMSRSGIVYDCVTWEAITVSNYTSPGFHGNMSEQRQRLIDNQPWAREKVAIGTGVIDVLNSVIDRLKLELGTEVISVLNLACEDEVYMTYFHKARQDVDYTCGPKHEPSAAIHVSHNASSQNDNARVHVKYVDIVNTSLEESYDVIICGTMLHRLKINDIIGALINISKSGSKYFIGTTFADVAENTDVFATWSRFRPLNFEIAPFSVGPPLCARVDSSSGRNHLAMWKLPFSFHLLDRESRKWAAG